MKGNIIRLGSVGAHGVGGPEAGAIDLIYTYLLQKEGQNIYRHIHINQVGNDLDELVIKEPGNKIHVNIRYPFYNDFESKSVVEKNKIRLEVMHLGLLEIAKFDEKLDRTKLESIKNEVLRREFNFDFVYKAHTYKKNDNLTGKLIIHPQMEYFKFYISIEEKNLEKCRQLIYIGKPTDYYFAALFHYGKWVNENLFIVSGRSPEVEFKLNIDKCRVELINKTNYENAPFFEMMKANLSQQNKDKAYKDWLHTLPPWAAAVVDEHPS